VPYKTKLLASLSDLEKAVGPGLHFRPREFTDVSWISFVLDSTKKNGCSSAVGRVGGKQIVYAITNDDGTDCVGSKHEIMHALGAVHEHSRRDRDQYLNVYWNRMKGCLNSATSISDCGHLRCTFNLAECGCTAETDANRTCYAWPSQIAREDKSQLAGPYDYGSTMHYRGCVSNKTPGLCEMEAKLTDPSTGKPYQFGDVWEPSSGDITGLRVLYPAATFQPVVFSSTGTQEVCSLAGRTDDIATESMIIGLPFLPKTCSFDTTGLPEGDYSVSVTIRNQFATLLYDYPNTSLPFVQLISYDEFTTGGTVKVLNPGLIAVFASI
jgi:hypothetical protein